MITNGLYMHCFRKAQYLITSVVVITINVMEITDKITETLFFPNRLIFSKKVTQTEHRVILYPKKLQEPCPTLAFSPFTEFSILTVPLHAFYSLEQITYCSLFVVLAICKEIERIFKWLHLTLR